MCGESKSKSITEQLDKNNKIKEVKQTNSIDPLKQNQERKNCMKKKKKNILWVYFNKTSGHVHQRNKYFV